MIPNPTMPSVDKYATGALELKKPDELDYTKGVEPLQTLPAAWFNYFTQLLTEIGLTGKADMVSLIKELTNMLIKAGVTPDAADNEQLSKLLATIPTPNSIMFRDALGRAKVASPLEDDDVTNKKFVLESFGPGGGGTSTPDPKTLIRRDDYARAQVAEPEADSDIATKKTVYDAFGEGGPGVPIPTPNTIIRRDAGGRAQVEQPLLSQDIVNKEYLDRSRLITTKEGLDNAPEGIRIYFPTRLLPKHFNIKGFYCYGSTERIYNSYKLQTVVSLGTSTTFPRTFVRSYTADKESVGPNEYAWTPFVEKDTCFEAAYNFGSKWSTAVYSDGEPYYPPMAMASKVVTNGRSFVIGGSYGSSLADLGPLSLAYFYWSESGRDWLPCKAVGAASTYGTYGEVVGDEQIWLAASGDAKGGCIYSEDGINWQHCTMPTDAPTVRLTTPIHMDYPSIYPIWVASSHNDISGTAGMYYSYDGKVWERADIPANSSASYAIPTLTVLDEEYGDSVLCTYPVSYNGVIPHSFMWSSNGWQWYSSTGEGSEGVNGTRTYTISVRDTNKYKKDNKYTSAGYKVANYLFAVNTRDASPNYAKTLTFSKDGGKSWLSTSIRNVVCRVDPNTPFCVSAEGCIAVPYIDGLGRYLFADLSIVETPYQFYLSENVTGLYSTRIFSSQGRLWMTGIAGDGTDRAYISTVPFSISAVFASLSNAHLFNASYWTDIVTEYKDKTIISITPRQAPVGKGALGMLFSTSSYALYGAGEDDLSGDTCTVNNTIPYSWGGSTSKYNTPIPLVTDYLIVTVDQGRIAYSRDGARWNFDAYLYQKMAVSELIQKTYYCTIVKNNYYNAVIYYRAVSPALAEQRIVAYTV